MSRFKLFCLLVIVTPLALANGEFDRWRASDPESSIRPDHGLWSTLLERYLVMDSAGINRFRYGEVSPADDARLSAYLNALQQVEVTRLAPAVQMAYWINLYNALTVRVVLDHYPVDSIRDIRFGLLDFGPWSEELVRVEGVSLSLDDIEHRILRPVFDDYRIHFAVNCAALGCPNLQSPAFTAENLESMLDAGARAYVNHPRGFRIDSQELVASSLFDWYEEDFGTSPAALIERLSPYAEPLLRAQLSRFERIDDYEYDWSLNDG